MEILLNFSSTFHIPRPVIAVAILLFYDTTAIVLRQCYFTVLKSRFQHFYVLLTVF